jgi:outer membrane biosynthesis protein TonB
VQPSLKRGAAYSAILHVLILLSLIVAIPRPLPPPPPPDDTVDVEFDNGTAASAQKSQDRGTAAAAAESDHPATENPALEKPKPVPLEKPPPPPPPPPKPPPPQLVQTLQPAKILPPPPSVVAEAIKPPPPVKVPPTKQPEQTKEKFVDTVTHQPHPTKNPAIDTHSFDNTMEKLLADQKQTKPPKNLYNPDRGGARNAGGQVHGNLTGALSEKQRKTIGDEVRRCYAEDTEAKDYATYHAQMVVTIDAQGVARDVKLSPADLARAGSDQAFRAFAERAMHAVLDPTCAQLPIPADKLGKPAQQLSFTFRP